MCVCDGGGGVSRFVHARDSGGVVVRVFRRDEGSGEGDHDGGGGGV